MARLFTDENLPIEVAHGLRARGHDVLTALEAGRANQGIDDENVLVFATRQNRAVITLNRRDFIRLHASFPHHTGIIICTLDTNFARQTEQIDLLLRAHPILDGLLLRVVRPQR